MLTRSPGDRRPKPFASCCVPPAVGPTHRDQTPAWAWRQSAPKQALDRTGLPPCPAVNVPPSLTGPWVG